MKIELNPVKWIPKKAVTTPAAIEQVRQSSTSAKAVENTMSTTATPVAAASQPNGFIRFIDAIGNFFKKSAPEIEEVAKDAEPFLALTPFGPEYDLVVNAIIGAQQTATASLATGVALTGVQKMAIVLQAVTPGLSSILASKKVTSGIPAAISEFAQNVYNLQTGPTTTVVPAATKAAA